MTGSRDGLLGVILAAGKSTRMAPFSERYPKPILPIAGRPLLVFQVETLRALGIRRVLVVIGHLGHEIVATLGDGRALGVEIEYVDQGETLGLAHALVQLEHRIDRPFVLFLGDIYFIHDGLEPMLAALAEPGVAGVLAVKRERDPDAIRRNFIVLEDEQGFVTKVVEKPRHPRSQLKGCGLYAFEPAVFDALRRTPRTALRDEYELTDAIQIFIDDGYRVRAARVVTDDLNLSYPRDLLEVNLRVLGEDSFVGEGVRLPEGCRLERAVLMDGVVVERPITIRESLVFPGVRLARDHDLERRIVTGHEEIDCRR